LEKKLFLSADLTEFQQYVQTHLKSFYKDMDGDENMKVVQKEAN